MSAPRSIAVTGAAGFLGWHLRCRLRALAPETDVRCLTHAEFDDDALLLSALAGVDAVVHLAGANRGSEASVFATNIALADRLVGALDEVGGSPYVVYANTTQSRFDTSYGRSKREAGRALAAWGRRRGTPVGDLRFPNLFGEGGRPNYNSAVATFCDELARGDDSAVNPDGYVELLHAQDACALILERLETPSEGTERVKGQDMSIPEVYARLARLHTSYRAAALPELKDRLDLRLFNALRTAMFPARYPLLLKDHRDQRGVFMELARADGQCQTSFITTAPARTRGDHFHLDKVERFVVVAGTGIIKLRRLLSDDVVSFTVSGEQPVAVDMPPLYAHSITNIGTDDLLTVLWANDHFNSRAPDTFAEEVEPASVRVGV